MRSLSTSAFGHPSETKLTFGGAACSEVRLRPVMAAGASEDASLVQVEVRSGPGINVARVERSETRVRPRVPGFAMLNPGYKRDRAHEQKEGPQI